MNNFSKQLLSSIKKWVIPSIGILALFIFSSMILFEATKATVDVTQNGETITIKTHSRTIEDLIEELDLTIEDYDYFSHDMNDSVVNQMTINHKEAKEVYVTIDDNKTAFYTTADTVEQFLTSEELEFSEYDDLSFNSGDEITSDLDMIVTQAYQVTLDDAGKATKVWTTGGLVSDILQNQDVTLKEIDKIKPAIDESLNKDTKIQITRVEKATDKVEEAIAFTTEKRNDNSLDKGKELVVANGQKGTRVKTFEVTKENGKEVSRKLKNEKVVKEQKNKVVVIGTKEAPQQNLVTLATKRPTKQAPVQQEVAKQAPAAKPAVQQVATKQEAPKQEVPKQKAPKQEPAQQVPAKQELVKQEPTGGQEMTMTATAYSADCTGCSGITRTGINLKADRSLNVIAVDPNVIPLGSTVWVEGYGTAVAGDTGGDIIGNRIDLHYPSHAEAMKFGVRKVKIKIIK